MFLFVGELSDRPFVAVRIRRPKMVSDSFVTYFSKPGSGIIFTSSFHNAQMSDSSCTVLSFEPSV